MLDKTLGYLLCCQSPGLFLLSVLLLLKFLAGRRRKKVCSFFCLMGCLLCVAGGVALYFFGIYKEYFTIRDFFVIRTAGWIGLAVAAVITVLTAVRAFLAAADARRMEKAAAREENQRRAQEAVAETAAAEVPAEREAPAMPEETEKAEKTEATAAECGETVQ